MNVTTIKKWLEDENGENTSVVLFRAINDAVGLLTDFLEYANTDMLVELSKYLHDPKHNANDWVLSAELTVLLNKFVDAQEVDRDSEMFGGTTCAASLSHLFARIITANLNLGVYSHMANAKF